MTQSQLTDHYWAAVKECLETFFGKSNEEALRKVQEVRGKIAKIPALERLIPQERRDVDVNDDPKEQPTLEDLIYHAEPWNVASDIAGVRKPPTGDEVSEYRELLLQHGLAPRPRGPDDDKPLPLVDMVQITHVRIVGGTYDPPVVQVAPGDTVTWTNEDPAPHDVVADAEQFASEILGIGASYSHVFTTAETVTYYCSIHPHMRGRVVVS